MKFLGYILLFFSCTSFAQTQDSLGKKEIFTMVEKMPEYNGGPNEMMKFIQKNINYPLLAKEKGMSGKVYLKFIINELGGIDSVSVLKSTGYKILDDEAIRLIKSMPKWKPGTQNEKPVPVFFNLPINFQLSDPGLGTKYYNSALKDFEAGKYYEAKEKYLKAYKYNSRDIDAVYNLGVTYIKLNQKDSACFYWNEMKIKFATSEADALIKKYCTN